MVVTNSKQATIEDVATAAGVSVATVSRALRDLPNVAPSTRQRVRSVADSLEYVAHPAASRLAAGRTGTVAVVLPLFDSWYFAKIIAGIEAVLRSENVDLLLYAVASDEERLRFLAGRGAWWQRGDALIMIDVRLTDAEAARLRTANSIIVTIGCETQHFSSIILNEREAVAKAADHLIAAGHSRIGLLTGETHAVHFRVPELRRQGFADRLVSAGLTPDPDLEQPGDFSVDGGREGMARLLDLPSPPTAVFALSDEMAFGALDELRRRGLSAPDDVAVVGFDDNDMAPLFGLTTIRQNVESIGALASRMVLRTMNDSDAPPERVVAPTELMIRRTA